MSDFNAAPGGAGSLALPSPVLIIDDDPFIRTVVAAVLKEAGVSRVKACASGEEALSMAPDFAPRLVLLDYVMPGLNGRATWDALRARLTPQPLVLFMTARSQDEVQAEMMGEGILGVIAKPFNPLTLADALRALLGRSAAPTANPTGLERLAAVAAEYRRTLHPTADVLEQTLADLQRAGWQRDTAEVLLGKAHNLAGSAGLFGLHDLGAAAEAAERLLSQAQKREAAPEAHDLQQIDAALRALITTCRL
jgi:two-component system OmpR family response regulator